MADYIDIDTPIDVAVYQRNRRIQVTLRQILDSNDAKYQPADVRPVVRGKWIIDRAFGNDVMSNEQMVICSACHKEIFLGEQNFCPNCGADMREES